MTKYLIFLGVVIGVVMLMNLFGGKKGGQEKLKALYQYKRKAFFMTRAEHEFFDLLVSHMGSEYYVFPQVHLSTLLDHKTKGQSWKGAFLHINGKSVDFVICDKAYIRPIVAIELDDHSHEREDRQVRDYIVEEIFTQSELPLVRIENKPPFPIDNIVSRIREVIKK